jgi:hypothetical protein
MIIIMVTLKDSKTQFGSSKLASANERTSLKIMNLDMHSPKRLASPDLDVCGMQPHCSKQNPVLVT